MDLTNPFLYVRPTRRFDLEELISALREDLAAELDAINLYQAHYDATDNELARQVLAHIRDEEKEHAAEFTQLINQLDAVQRAMFAVDHLQEIQQEEAEAQPLQEMGTREDMPKPDRIKGLTVGDLFGQKQA